jgi:predicted MPP superfamily phosphohydrolase
VRFAPLGTLRMDTHDGPIGLDLRADELRLEEARRVVDNPGELESLGEKAAVDARRAVRGVLLRAALGALVGALLLTGVRELSLRSAAIAAGTALFLVGSVSVTARASWDEEALSEPRYTGLLTVAPNAVGSVEQLQTRYSKYRAQLTRLIGNVASLYQTTSTLDGFQPASSTVRILHVSDLHLNPQGFDLTAQIRKQFRVDAVVDTGDIVDWGTELESRYTSSISALGVPYVYVRGNHDSQATAAAVAAQPNAVVLDDSSTDIKGIRIWGIGDPRFTPDKQTAGTKDEERRQAVEFAATVADRIEAGADIALVHDPATAAELDGRVPLVLAGHMHRPSERRLGDSGSLLLVEGSTGGAGLRTLEAGKPVPLVCSVLYIDPTTRRLVAYDRITVGGLGSAEVSIERHVVKQPAEPPPG